LILFLTRNPSAQLMIRKINSYALKLFDVSYSVKFLLRMVGLYLLFRLINWSWIGLIAPGGLYSAFADNYLNYVSFIKVSVLQTARLMANIFGVSSHLVSTSVIKVEGGGELYMAWACCGLELMSFWAAFALADTTPLRTKLKWCLGGLFSIWLINCVRVSLIMIAQKNKWQNLQMMTHHDTFNIAAYALIIFLMFIYYKKNKKQFGEQHSKPQLFSA
jgi:exosortase/archaeosortase family protein